MSHSPRFMTPSQHQHLQRVLLHWQSLILTLQVRYVYHWHFLSVPCNTFNTKKKPKSKRGHSDNSKKNKKVSKKNQSNGHNKKKGKSWRSRGQHGSCTVSVNFNRRIKF